MDVKANQAPMSVYAFHVKLISVMELFVNWSEKVVLCIWSGITVVMGNRTNINIFLNIYKHFFVLERGVYG